MAQPDDYTVGWICAIRTEYVAARAFLDEEHEGPAIVSPNDNNAYTLGKIWGHNVVIAVLPDGEYGTSSAASVARDMMHSFRNIRVGLMVGIGGGAPSKGHDIRLGDIVVSAPRDGKGGVFQYDFGKTIQDQSFRPTGFLNQPPTVLRTAVTVISGQYESDGHGLEGDIQNILQKKKRLQKSYSRPDPSSDRLYRSKIVHPRDCDSCSAAFDIDLSKIVRRLERTEDEDNPAIHYGIIASGNQLLKDALVRDKLAAEEDILCFEMEAAGLMNHFPCLVIRGICDYSDSHKNKEWQGYAAMTAAAYAKDLLRRIAPNRIEAEKKISEVLFGIQKGIDEIVQVKHGQDNEEILDWLTPTEYGPQHSDFLHRREPGTGQWFLDCAEYQTWLSSNKCTLFCPGIPGSGKTILTAIVVNDLITRFRNDPTIGIAYIYFSFQQRVDQTIENLMASLLKQLARSQSFPESVKDLYDRHGKDQTRPSADEIGQALQSVATTYSKVFIVIDALDECHSFNDCGLKLLSYIFNLQTNTTTNFFATSRPILNIEKRFKKHLRREILATNEDVCTYIEGHMSDLPRCILNRRDIQEKIKTEIPSAVDGMFLLAQLYLNSLKDKTSPKQIKSALEQFKKQSQLELGEDKKREILEEAYKQAMDRINSQMLGLRVLGRKVLTWITCAKRKLTTSELRHALAVEIGSTKLDQDNLPEIEDMISVCAGLVTVDKKSNIIRLVHYTTQEYFDRTRQNWFPDAEADITEICVTYLSFSSFFKNRRGRQAPIFTDLPSNSLEKRHCLLEPEFLRALKFTDLPVSLRRLLPASPFQVWLRSNPFFSYAANNWGHHARNSPDKRLILDFLESKAKTATLYRAMNSEERIGREQQLSRTMTCVHLAAYFGLTCITSLLKNGHDMNAEDDRRRTPLWWAVNNGHEAIVKLLLEEGADIKERAIYGLTLLQMAAKNGHEAITRLLLEKGADISAKDENSQTPLLLAAENGHEAVVQLLLNKGLTIETKGRNHRTLLLLAAENGHDALVRLLLKNGADVKARDKLGRTPLLLAAKEGHDVIAQLLLEKGADAEAKVFYQTPLLLAAEKGHEAIVQLLLNKGVNINVANSLGRTALLIAAEKGYKAIVQLLLHKDADVHVKDKFGRTVLLLAVGKGHTAIIQLLLKKGAYVNAKDWFSRTALLLAVTRGHEAIVRLLLEYGADIKAKDGEGQTPLSLAIKHKHEDIVKLIQQKS